MASITAIRECHSYLTYLFYYIITINILLAMILCSPRSATVTGSERLCVWAAVPSFGRKSLRPLGVPFACGVRSVGSIQLPETETAILVPPFPPGQPFVPPPPNPPVSMCAITASYPTFASLPDSSRAAGHFGQLFTPWISIISPSMYSSPHFVHFL